jgi:3-phosphoshikimate 1-carboxyvinyltransferase
MDQKFEKISKINGTLKLPGDKSISHRALLFAAMANGTSLILNLSGADDINSTKNCLKQLGVIFHETQNSLFVDGLGFKGFKKPEKELNAGNSGTTARLLTGILSVQDFSSVIIGDSSLNSRPMKRVITPLKQMGANINVKEDQFLPLEIFPVSELKNIEYTLPVASAQVKSAVLLAGLFGQEKTYVIEKNPSRDHTERMLKLEIEMKDNLRYVSSSKLNYPASGEFFIPGDISTAAYFIVLTLLTKDSELKIENVSLNPTRLGFVNHLKKMGADITIEIVSESRGEPFGILTVKSSELENKEISKEQVPGMIDEIPILSIAGILAKGEFILRGASELKVKETDRIQTFLFNLEDSGLGIEKYEDGYKLSGSIKSSGKEKVFKSFGDHRMAMSFAILSGLLSSGGTVENFECASVSNPQFLEQLQSITA